MILWLCCMVATLQKVRAGRSLQVCKCCRSDGRLPDRYILQDWQGREARHVWHALHAILVSHSGARIGWYGPKLRARALHSAHSGREPQDTACLCKGRTLFPPSAAP